jgi:serine/threonine-protein kinase
LTRATIHAVRPGSRQQPLAGIPGEVLGGKYRLEETIARGGMARVWRATHVTLNRPVAVKFIESWGDDDERIERFLKEAKVAASIRHRYVVDILDFGTSRDGEPYMVMELLEGEPLDQRLMRGPLEIDEFIDISTQLLSGLDAVHRGGIVHRDLKPGNVFLSNDEVDGVFARLLDFGISQDVDEVSTQQKVVIGTPEYMSPEQAFGDPLDFRSDIYSAGVVLYEMLSGTVPFEHSDPQQVVELVAHGTPPPIKELRPDLPELCEIVERAMARDPGDRYQSAREMRHALLSASGRRLDSTGNNSWIPRDSHVSGTQARVANGQSTSTSTGALPWAKHHRTWSAILVLAILLGGTALALSLGQASESSEPRTDFPAADTRVEDRAEDTRHAEETRVTIPASAAPTALEEREEAAPRVETETDPDIDTDSANEAAQPRRRGERRPEKASPSILRELDF